VQPPDERREGGAELYRAERRAAYVEAGREQAHREPVDQHGAHGVEEHGGEVIARRVHAPDEIVQREGEPGDRDVVTHVHRGKDPGELGRTEAAVVRIVDEILPVVPAQEGATDGG
jgi:hypothetical protein